MIISVEQWEQLFDEIKNDLRTSEEKKVTVFVSSTECDSVCATRIFQDILSDADVHHSVQPVEDYTQLREQCQQVLQDQNDDRNVFFINCGASQDLKEMLQLKPETRAIVIDSHRPVHHAYSDGSDNRLIFMHDPSDGTPAGPTWPSLDSDPDASGKESESEDPVPSSSGRDAAELDEKENAPPSQRHGANGEARSPRSWRRRRKRRRLAEAQEAALRDYYAAAPAWGKPAALLMYDVAHTMHAADACTLWLSIVGLTDHQVHQRVPAEQYAQYCNAIAQLVAQGELAEEDEEPYQDVDVLEGPDLVTYRQRRTFYGRIMPVEDLALPLMRQWTLYDALTHAPYVAVRLQTWQTKGQRRVDALLTRMGLPLRDCRREYCTKPHMWRDLGSKLQRHAVEVGLLDVTFRSFQLRFGAALPLWAADVAHAAGALLEDPGRRHGQDLTPAEKFWRAHNAVGMRDKGEFAHGVELAKRLRRHILSDGGLILVRRIERVYSKFLCVNLSEEEISNRDTLAHPLALTKLGLFLRDAYAQRAGRRRALVLVGPPSEPGPAGACAVLGLADAPMRPAAQATTFGTFFEQTARNIGAEYRHDGFSASVIQVNCTDVKRFLRDLALAASQSSTAL